MGTGDGSVQGLATLINNGPNNTRLNIVLVAEGFQLSEQSDFETACDDFVTTLQAEAWFPILGGAINVHRLNVASDESGADDPATCGDGSAGSGASPATYFDSSFCNSGIRRCLAGNETIVRDELDTALPEWHVAAVLVNTSQRGGCASNDVFWTALSSDWKDVVLHELGHAAFGLADEYQVWAGCDIDTDRDNAPLGEPPEPNVTANTSAATLKWRNLLSPGMPVPTMLNPDCTECDERPNAVSDDTPSGSTRARSTTTAVASGLPTRAGCATAARPSAASASRPSPRSSATFITPTPALEVEPASLDFGDIGEGMTMYRALRSGTGESGFPASCASPSLRSAASSPTRPKPSSRSRCPRRSSRPRPSASCSSPSPPRPAAARSSPICWTSRASTTPAARRSRSRCRAAPSSRPRSTRSWSSTARAA